MCRLHDGTLRVVICRRRWQSLLGFPNAKVVGGAKDSPLLNTDVSIQRFANLKDDSTITRTGIKHLNTKRKVVQERV